MYKKSRFTIAIPIQDKKEGLVALYHVMTRAFVLMPKDEWKRLLHPDPDFNDEQTLNMLFEEGILVKRDVDETALFFAWKQQYVHDFTHMGSKNLVTWDCNNRCTYCIIDPEARKMSGNTARKIDDFYIEQIRAKHPKKVRDDYLGGEPLLNPGVIKESAARRYYFCRGLGIDYGFTMTTNGVLLTPEKIETFKRVGLTGIRVSMAGPGPVHDALRPHKNGSGTYETIMKNLETISGRIPISIECQYDAGSEDYRRIPEMLEDFANRNIKIDEIAFTPILPRRGEDPFDNGMEDVEKFLFLQKEAAKRNFPVHQDPPSNACMTDFKSSYVFDTDGAILPCPSLQGGEMAYGHTETGIDFVAESQILDRKLPDKCLNGCKFLPLCMGGCRLQAMTQGNGFGGVHCLFDTYERLLEDYILAEAKKNLAHAKAA